MKHETTSLEQAPSDSPLRAKNILRHTVIIVTDATDYEIQKMISVFKPIDCREVTKQ